LEEGEVIKSAAVKTAAIIAIIIIQKEGFL